MNAFRWTSVVVQKIGSKCLINSTIALSLLMGTICGAADLPPKQSQAALYTSEIDQRLTIRKIAVLPGTDNTDGIYARPVQSQLITLVQSSHRWEFVDSGFASLNVHPLELEENPTKVKELTKDIDADAFLVPIVTRGPGGLAIRLDLFLKVDGKMVAQEVSKEQSRFELNDVKAKTVTMYNALLGKIPYDGLILSRQGNRVTLNLGKSDGIHAEQDISVIQVISENRHPKFGFLISTEKEILGKVRIAKVDDTLSFGMITAEKERGAIQKGAKIAGVRPIEYGEQALSGEDSGDIRNRPDAKTAFGESAQEWVPVRPPAFGQIGIKAGLGYYVGSTNLTGVGSLEAKADYYPLLNVNGELWLNPQWTVLADMTQAIMSTSNPRGGSSPGTLNHSMSKYSMSLGYNFLIRDDFFGPKFQLRTGLSFYRMFVDDSTPQGLTTVNYNGYLIGLGLYFPIADESPWAIGGDLALTLFSKLTESPVQSGDSATNTINEFSIYLERKIGVNLRARGGLDFSLYSSSLTGAGTRTEPATTISQRYVNAAAGLACQF